MLETIVEKSDNVEEIQTSKEKQPLLVRPNKDKKENEPWTCRRVMKGVGYGAAATYCTGVTLIFAPLAAGNTDNTSLKILYAFSAGITNWFMSWRFILGSGDVAKKFYSKVIKEKSLKYFLISVAGTSLALLTTISTIPLPQDAIQTLVDKNAIIYTGIGLMSVNTMTTRFVASTEVLEKFVAVVTQLFSSLVSRCHPSCSPNTTPAQLFNLMTKDLAYVEKNLGSFKNDTNKTIPSIDTSSLSAAALSFYQLLHNQGITINHTTKKPWASYLDKILSFAFIGIASLVALRTSPVWLGMTGEGLGKLQDWVKGSNHTSTPWSHNQELVWGGAISNLLLLTYANFIFLPTIKSIIEQSVILAKSKYKGWALAFAYLTSLGGIGMLSGAGMSHVAELGLENGFGYVADTSYYKNPVFEWLSSITDSILSLPMSLMITCGLIVNGVSAAQLFYDLILRIFMKCKSKCFGDNTEIAIEAVNNDASSNDDLAIKPVQIVSNEDQSIESHLRNFGLFLTNNSQPFKEMDSVDKEIIQTILDKRRECEDRGIFQA